MPEQRRPITGFCSYSHQDDALREQLDRHLASLKREGLIDVWHDRRIPPGAEWKGQIDQNLETAELILLLVSADFLHSDYCTDIEARRALQRHAAGQARVVPVILRPCDWHNSEIGKLQALPTDGRPVTSQDWDLDAALTDVAHGIRRVVLGLQDRPAACGRSPAGLSPGPSAAVVAKGLLSYDENDAGFFLQLVPPPFDRGLPQFVRWWKEVIEQPDPERTFCVDYLYGPSGCGKSSLVKAALLPHLDPDKVLAVHVESTGDATEARLLRAIRKLRPELPQDQPLEPTLRRVADTAAADGRPKVLFVLDQFEQWLHVHRADAEPELVRALRVCDGSHLQCLLVVRPEFQVYISRLAAQLPGVWRPNLKMSLVELFDQPHARHVLAEFGRSYGVPRKDAETWEAFLEQAVAALADEDGRVVAVRLALFARMLKGREWTEQTLAVAGGVDRVGQTFLEQHFSRAGALYRRFERAAQRTLKELLPEPGADIKGRMQPAAALRQASGQSDADFAELMQVLGNELKLVTPTVPESGEESGESAAEPHYQLTHDYVVPSVRGWLNAGLQKTWRGRAQLRLEERTAQWQHGNRDRRFLPGPVEFISILLGVPCPRYQPPQRAMMRAASRRYGAIAAVSLVFLMAGAVGFSVLRGRSNAPGLVEAFVGTVEPSEFQQKFDSGLVSHRRWVLPHLVEQVRRGPESGANEEDRRLRGRRRANAAIGLWRLGAADAALDALRVREDPESLTQFVHRCKAREIQAEELWQQLTAVNEPVVRYGLLLALGEFARGDIPDDRRGTWAKTLGNWYRDDPSSAVHSACGWLLRQWGENERVRAVDQTHLPYAAGREWFIEKVECLEPSGGGPDYFTFIVFRPGTFTMGSPENEAGRFEGETPHTVQLTQPFAVCDREVTRSQYARSPGGTSDGESAGSNRANHPQNSVSWDEAFKYCQWLTTQAKRTDGERFRLPTEAEWEYACRAGTSTRFSSGSDESLLKNYARFDQPPDVNNARTLPCGSLRPSPGGLFDIHGNVFEWCNDRYGEYPKGAVKDPLGPPDGDLRVLRGGSWINGFPAWCRSSARFVLVFDAGNSGFRVCVSVRAARTP